MKGNLKGYDFSIMPLDTRYVNEICNDIKEQYEKGIADLALFCMTLVPENNPPKNKVEGLCKKYEIFRKRLAEMGLECGVLVQSSIGHGYPINENFPFRRYVGRLDGEEKNKYCPYDEGFRAHFKWVMRTIAEHHPKAIMVDDDFRLLFFYGKGCACELHMNRFNELAGTNLTREELNEHLRQHGETSEYANIYLETQKEALVGAANAMRMGIDSVDPSIQGMYCTTGKACEFAPEIARALAGEGNPTIVRTFNGVYCPAGTKKFTHSLYNTASEVAILKDQVDVLLAESDTCPQNRYAMSAQHMHSFLVGAILEGAVGSKKWITRLMNYEPESGKAYRTCLEKHKGFYTALKQLVPNVTPFGCRIPVFDKPSFSLDSDRWDPSYDGWSACFLERVGIPMYFSAKNDGVTFLEGSVDQKYTDEQIRALFCGNVILASDTARDLNNRGFLSLTGVEVCEWKGDGITGEVILFDQNICQAQKNSMELKPINDQVLVESYAFQSSDQNLTKDYLFPASTLYKNPLGGTTVVFSGTPVCEFYYTEGFSFLNETRKKQMVRILEDMNQLPLYYPGDAELYLRAGTLPDGKYFVTVFNLGFDPLDELPLNTKESIASVKLLGANGEWKLCDFKQKADEIVIDTPVYTLEPVVLLLDAAQS